MPCHVRSALFKLLGLTLFLSQGPVHAQEELVRDAVALGQEATASVTTDQFKSGLFKASDGTILPYRLLAPSHPVAGRAYPLVLQLHGSGGIGTDNVGQLERLARTWAMPDVRERFQAYVVVPQFPIRSANYGPAAPDQQSSASPALRAALELAHQVAARHPVERSRIYAVGFSMGGSAAWLLPSLQPDLLAAIVPISGVAPASSLAGVYRDLPVLIVHGNADDENPITADRRFFAAITSAGGKKVRLRVYDGLDHRPPADIYPGLWWRDWLFEQRRH
jgi:predicted peptidase